MSIYIRTGHNAVLYINIIPLYLKTILNNMYQEIIVGIIGVFVTLSVIYKMYSFFFSKKKQNDTYGCSNCGCSTKQKHI